MLVTPPPGVTAVTNRDAFTGGADGESDEELRERVLESCRNIPNGTNSAFYREFALQYEGVYSAAVSPRARGTGTVDVYVASRGDVPGGEVITQIQNDLNALKEINVDVQVKGAEKVSVDIILYLVPKAGYDYSELKLLAEQALRDYMGGLSIGESVYMTRAAAVVYGVEGVEQCWPEPLLCHDVAVQSGQLAVAGTIGVSPKVEDEQ
ncbi:MAG: baseplate J/gp47 family protein [[Clostridium] leptum]